MNIPDVIYTGWDIGGAHLKVAGINGDGKLEFVEQYATPLWRGLESLEKTLPSLLKQHSRTTMRHAVTMTAELVDIFKDRRQGISTVLAFCEKNLGAATDFYAVGKGLLNLESAKKHPDNVASANWHAGASYAANHIETGIFMDIGSTTSDIIPFDNGRPQNRGYDDQSRLRFDELLYTGVVSTSLMSLVRRLPFNGEWQTVTAEHFASTGDIYRILGKLKASDDLAETADAGAKDIPGSIVRLARILGTDAYKYPQRFLWQQLASYIAEIQLQMLHRALARVMSRLQQPHQTLVGAGAGRFLVARIAARMGLAYIEFADLCKTDADLKCKCSSCAPAVALAYINRSRSA